MSAQWYSHFVSRGGSISLGHIQTYWCNYERDYAHGLMQRRMIQIGAADIAERMLDARIKGVRDSIYNTHKRALLEALWLATGSLGYYNTSTPLDVLNNSTHARARLVAYAKGFNNGNVFAREVINSGFGEAWRAQYDYVITNDDNLRSVSEVFSCEDCGNYFEIDEAVSVQQDSPPSDAVLVCEGCREENDYFRCELTDIVFSGANFTLATLDDGLCVCQEYCEENELIAWDDDDEEWRRTDERGNSPLMGYHSAARPWARSSNTPERAIGVELEIGFVKGNVARAAFLSKFVGARGRFKDDRPFSCERDGSLDGNVPGGMEIISDPLRLYEGYVAKDAPWRVLLNDLYKAGASGWQWRDYAGIHVNTDTRHVTDKDVLKYAIFISNAAALSKFVAGRKKIFGHDCDDTRFKMYTGGYTEKRAKRYGAVTTARALEEIFSTGKYAPVFRHDGYIETRIFGSNIRYEGFMACVEYCVSAMQFVSELDMDAVFSPTISAEFRSWLAAHSARYPNLSSRMGVIARPLGTAVPSTAKVVPLLAVA